MLRTRTRTFGDTHVGKAGSFARAATLGLAFLGATGVAGCFEDNYAFTDKPGTATQMYKVAEPSGSSLSALIQLTMKNPQTGQEVTIHSGMITKVDDKGIEYVTGDLGDITGPKKRIEFDKPTQLEGTDYVVMVQKTSTPGEAIVFFNFPD